MRRGIIIAAIMLALVAAGAFGQSVDYTVKTQAQLLQDFRDGLPQKSITPRNIRNIIGSLPMLSVVSVKTYGAVGDGSTDDKAAIQAALDATNAAFGGVVFFPNGTYMTSGQLVANTRVSIVGEHPLQTIIKATAGFPHDTAVIKVTPITGAYGALVRNIGIDCSDVPGSIGIYSDSAQELSGAKDVLIVNYRLYGIHFEGSGTQNFVLEDLWIYGSSLSEAESGIFIDGSSSSNPIRRVTISNAGGTQQAAPAVKISGSNVVLESIHAESHDDSVLFSAGSTGSANGVYGHSTIVNNIRISGSSGIVVLNATSNGSDVNIKDEFTGYTITTPAVSFYAVGAESNPTVLTTDVGSTNFIKGTLLIGDGLRAASTRIRFDNAVGGGSTFSTANTAGLLLQNQNQDGTFEDGGLHLVGGGSDNNPANGGVFSGSTSDLGTFTARAEHASGIQFYNGEVMINADTGLTPGATFTRSIKMHIRPIGTVSLSGVPFSNLGAASAGTYCYCSDCTIGSTCSGSGSGAWAFRTAGAIWTCPW